MGGGYLKSCGQKEDSELSRRESCDWSFIPPFIYSFIPSWIQTFIPLINRCCQVLLGQRTQQWTKQMVLSAMGPGVGYRDVLPSLLQQSMYHSGRQSWSAAPVGTQTFPLLTFLACGICGLKMVSIMSEFWALPPKEGSNQLTLTSHEQNIRCHELGTEFFFNLYHSKNCYTNILPNSRQIAMCLENTIGLELDRGLFEGVSCILTDSFGFTKDQQDIAWENTCLACTFYLFLCMLGQMENIYWPRNPLSPDYSSEGQTQDCCRESQWGRN